MSSPPSEPLPRPEPDPARGAYCSQHPERRAQYVCPRCGCSLCGACFQPALGRCLRCLAQGAFVSAPPVAWEAPNARLFQRYSQTLLAALHPLRSAASFARDEVRAAVHFALSTMLPLALLAGIIPYTRTLFFANWTIRVVEKPSGAEIALDIVRAMLIELGLAAIRFGCLFFPFVSLVRAYAPPGRHTAAMRVMLYRGWLLPAGRLLYYVAFWALPAAAASGLHAAHEVWPFLIIGFSFAAQVSLMMAMGATSRVACGLNAWLSFLVVSVPIVLWLLVDPLTSVAVERLLPWLLVTH